MVDDTYGILVNSVLSVGAPGHLATDEDVALLDDVETVSARGDSISRLLHSATRPHPECVCQLLLPTARTMAPPFLHVTYDERASVGHPGSLAAQSSIARSAANSVGKMLAKVERPKLGRLLQLPA